jgi:hypothetical protein
MQRRVQKTARLFAVIAMLGLLSTSLGCAFGEVYWTDPLKREYSLGEAQKRYTNLVRFGAFDQATRFVDPDLADSYIANFPSQSDLVFVDFEAGRIQFADDGMTDATIKVIMACCHPKNAPIMAKNFISPPPIPSLPNT